MAAFLRRASLFVTGFVGGLGLTALDLRASVVQAEAAVAPLSWLGVSGLVALLGVAVVWGRMQQQGTAQGKQIEQLFRVSGMIVPRSEIDRRMEEIRRETRDTVLRIERRLDELWERRSEQR